jgi:DNA helicase HerA-like ATPase
MDHHTAILGVTGSGKTELAFDLIRHSVEKGLKVLSIDLTARFEARLSDLNPKNLSLSVENVAELNKKLFDVETGTYGAGAEKKALEGFAKKIREDVQKAIQEFLTTTDDNNRIGIIALEEISNSKATLFITEMYLTCLLNYAKDNIGKAPKVLIVVDEAHTVMPEPSTMGLGDYDSRGLVGKIAQIALQGRKYGVGLLVIAQRTATVSKSILTQCNTVISFNCFDDTSLNFLSNVYGASYVPIIPNLPQLHAIVFGKGIRSQRPLIIQIPFDPKKAETPS